MRRSVRALLAACIALAGWVFPLSGQSIDGLLEAGREIVPPGSAVDLLAPLDEGAFRLGSAEGENLGWLLATSTDDLDRQAARVLVRNDRGAVSLYAGIGYATIDGIEEVQDYEPTGSEIPVMDVRLRAGLDVELTGRLWLGGDLRYLESSLADLSERNLSGMLRAGYRSEGASVVAEGTVLHIDDSDAFNPAVVRGAARLHIWQGFHVMGGLGWREREEVYGALAVRWTPSSLEALQITGGAEVGPEGLRTFGGSLRLRLGMFDLGLHAGKIGPFNRTLGGWVSQR